jgi:hypothetical protein
MRPCPRVSEAGSTVPPLRLTPCTTNRPDVSEHLRAAGRSPATDRHGLVAGAALAGSLSSPLRLSLVASHTTALSQELHVTAQHLPLGDLVRLAVEAARPSGTLLQNLRHVAKPLVIDPPDAPAVVKVRRFGPPHTPNPPRASIIVPFYGDSFFLLDHTRGPASCSG